MRSSSPDRNRKPNPHLSENGCTDVRSGGRLHQVLGCAALALAGVVAAVWAGPGIGASGLPTLPSITVPTLPVSTPTVTLPSPPPPPPPVTVPLPPPPGPPSPLPPSSPPAPPPAPPPPAAGNSAVTPSIAAPADSARVGSPPSSAGPRSQSSAASTGAPLTRSSHPHRIESRHQSVGSTPATGTRGGVGS